jgi:hypothetical protein
LLFFVAILSAGVSLAQERNVPQSAKPGINYGHAVVNKEVISVKEMESNLAVSNKFSGKVAGKVSGVCKMSGCYLTLQTAGDDNPIMVRFADDYTVPQDIVGKEVIVDGVASVRNKEHKETKRVQKAITFIADGVLVVK